MRLLSGPCHLALFGPIPEAYLVLPSSHIDLNVNLYTLILEYPGGGFYSFVLDVLA